MESLRRDGPLPGRELLYELAAERPLGHAPFGAWIHDWSGRALPDRLASWNVVFGMR